MIEDLDNQSQEPSLRSNKKYGKKVWYPFGSPAYTHHPYSEFCHLTADTRKFALSLATSSDIHAEIIDEEALELERKKNAEIKKKLMEKFSSLSSLYSKSLNQSHGNDGSTVCKEKKCQEMIKAVVSARTTFKIENASIQADYEELSKEVMKNEETLAVLQAKKMEVLSKGDELESILQQLKQDLDALVTQNMELIAERDGFQSKFIHYEYKIQTLIRQSQEASAALYKALWGDDSLHKEGPETLFKQDLKRDMMTIRQCKEDEVVTLSNPSITSYDSLARDDIIDYTEKLPILRSQTLSKSITLPAIDRKSIRIPNATKAAFPASGMNKHKTIRHASSAKMQSTSMSANSSFLSPLTNSPTKSKFQSDLMSKSVDNQSLPNFDQSSAWSSSNDSRGGKYCCYLQYMSPLLILFLSREIW
jgi:hypothetical protein